MNPHLTGITKRDLRGLNDEDLDRMGFLVRLDGADDIDLTDWELNFVAGFIESPRSMTPAQRAAVDEMRVRYEDQL